MLPNNMLIHKTILQIAWFIAIFVTLLVPKYCLELSRKVEFRTNLVLRDQSLRETDVAPNQVSRRQKLSNLTRLQFGWRITTKILIFRSFGTSPYYFLVDCQKQKMSVVLTSVQLQFDKTKHVLTLSMLQKEKGLNK